MRRRDTPLRELADEIGVSKSWVEQMVKEGRPPRKNAPKFIRWYLKDRRARYGSLPDDEYEEYMVVAVLESLANIPEGERRRALRAVVARYEELHEAAKAPRPGWLLRLREHLDGVPGGDAPPPDDAGPARPPEGP